MRASIADVAARAGVSRATASRALGGHPAVLPETRERVVAAAEALNYRGDPVARALRAGSSNLIGLIVSNLQNPAIQTVAEVIQTRGQTHGLEVLIGTTNDDGDRERRLIDTLAGRRVDGLITMSSGANTALLNDLHAGGLPVVDLIRLPPHTTTPAIVYDDLTAAALATQHLLDLGHRRVAFVGGPPSTRTGAERFAGFRSTMQAAHATIDTQLVQRGPFTPTFGVEAVQRLLNGATAPSAVLIANHEAMFSALQALNRAGIGVPEHISVVVIEDDPLLAWWHPPLTAVDVHPTELARVAMDSLLAQRGSPPLSQKNVVIAHPTLIDRSSVAPYDA